MYSPRIFKNKFASYYISSYNCSMKQLNKKKMETTTPETVTIKSRKRVQEYYGVSQIIDANGRLYYGASLSSERFPTLFKDIRKAAIFIDKLLIRQGRPPVNILVKINSN